MLIVPPSSNGETQFIPSLSTQEKYDSNILFIGGRNLDDFVTTLTPQLRVDHSNKIFEGSARGGLTSQVYVKNPGLNYVAGFGGTTLNFDEMASRIFGRGSSLFLTDTFRYTPEVPSFFASESGNQAPTPFVEGIQAARANSFSNMGSAIGSVPLSPQWSLTGNLTHQMIRFGSAQASPGIGSQFSTEYVMANAGPSYQVTAQDTVTLNYQYMKSSFSQGGGFGGGFQTQGGTLTYNRIFSPALKVTATGGITIVSATGSAQYLASTMIEWTKGRDSAKLYYNRSVMPSFFIGGLPLLSQTIGASYVRQVDSQLSLSGRVNYASNESVPAGILQFDSYGGSASASYTINRTLTAVAAYTYSSYKTDFRGSGFEYDRHQISMTLQAEWK